MKSNEQFNALHGVNNVSRSEVNDIIELAKQENNSAVIYRLSRILNRFENDEYFDFEIANYSQSGLNGAQHTGNYKDALDDCGRLKKGYKFQGGTVVKVAPKVKKVAPVKKTASDYGKKRNFEKKTNNSFLGYDVENFDLQSAYDFFNKKLYNNELPKILLGYKAMKNKAGIAGAKVLKSGRNVKVLSVDYIYLTSSYKFSNERKLGTFLHEMIHIYLFSKGIWNTSGINKSHGKEFVEEKERLDKILNTEIPLTENILDCDFKGNGRLVNVILINNEVKNQYFIGVFNQNIDVLSKEIFVKKHYPNGLISFLKTKSSVASKYKIQNKKSGFEIYGTNDKDYNAILEDCTTVDLQPKINKTASDYGRKTKREKKQVAPVEKTEPKKEVAPTENKYPFSKEDIPYDVGYNAHRGTSFSPEKRAIQEQKSYFDYLKSVYDEQLEKATKKGTIDDFTSRFTVFQAGYLKRNLALLYSRSGLFSTMITGGSNFPVRRMEKKNIAVNNKLNELIAYSNKFRWTSKEESGIIKTGSSTALDQLKEKLRKEEESHELTLKFNKIMRKKATSEQKEKELLDAGFSEKTIFQVRKDNFQTLPNYISANRSGRVRELKRRIAEEEKLKAKSTDQTIVKEATFNGGKIEYDYEANRIKLHFDSIPSVEIRNFIKKGGQAFKWSSFNKVWQRQLNTYYSSNKKDLFEFLGVNIPKKEVESKVEEVEKPESKKEVASSGQLKLLAPRKSKKALKSPAQINYVPIIDAGNIKTVGKIKSINDTGREQNNFFTVNGQVGKFLQQVERKPFESVVITLDGMQGAGKTTTLYKFIDAFASAGNSSLFISGEEHPESSLAVEKRDKYLSAEAKRNTSIVGDVESIEQLYQYVKPYDIIFIDSWQKLQRMVGNIRLDEDLRKKFNGKVFVVIFQQTTTGRTKGGAEVVFDGDIIIKMVKEPSFSDNYAYFDKNRYTKIPIENIRYNIASGKTYNPNAPQKEELQSNQNNEFSFNIK